MWIINYLAQLNPSPEDAYPFLAVCAFVVLDVTSGFTVSLFTKSFRSDKMRKGIANKIGEIMAMVLIYAISVLLPLMGLVSPKALKVFPVMLGSYIVIMEIGSILENISKLSPKSADKIKSMMEDKDDEYE